MSDKASILSDYKCSDCGWQIIHACCNDEFADFSAKEENDGPWDWWMYCSNKGCKNHHGEGVFQGWPDWVV